MTTVSGASGPDERPDQRPDEAPGGAAEDAAAPPPGASAQRAPADRPWVRAAIAAVATFVVVGAALAYLVRPGASPTQVAGLLPAATVAYAEVTAEPSGDQRALLFGLLQRFPGFEDQSRLGQKIDETFSRLLSGSDIDYTSKVKPWLGSSAAVAVWPAEGATEASVVLFLASSNDPAAQAFIDDRAQVAARSRGRHTEETYRDVVITSVTESGEEFAPVRAWAAAVYSKHLLVGSTATAIKGIVDVGEGIAPTGSAGAASLADTKLFRDAMAALPAARIATLFVNQGALFDWIAGGQRFLGAPVLPFEFTGEAALVGSLRAETDSAVFDLVPVGQLGVTRNGTPVVAPTPPADLLRPHASRLDRVLPADALMSGDIHDLGPLLRFELDVLRQTQPEFADQLRSLEQAVALLGLSLDDVFGAVGDAAIVMVPRQSGVELSIPLVGFVAEVRDQALAQRILGQLNAAISLSGRSEVVTEDYRGVTFYRATPPGDGGGIFSLSPTWGLSGDLLVLTSDTALAHSIVDVQNGAASLASDPDYQAVMKRAGTENNGAFFLDVAGFVEFSRRYTGATVPDEAAAFIKPFAAIGWTIVSRTSGGTAHFRTVVLIK